MDFGWRNYEASLGRWMNIDPLTDEYDSTSPYTFVGNNPITNLEIDGRFWIRTEDENGTVTYTAEKGDSAWSLFTQFGEEDGLSAEMANTLIEGILGPNYRRESDGMLMSDVEVEDVLTVYTEQEDTNSNEEEGALAAQELSEVEKLDSTINTWSAALKVGFKICCYGEAKRYSEQKDFEKENPELALQWKILNGTADTYKSGAAPGMEESNLGSSFRSTRTRSTRTGRTRPRSTKTSTGNVTVSGQSKTVQTGPQGGKYYINKNGGKTYLNRDGTKRIR